MAAARSEYPPDQRGLTPRRQLLTVSELEQLFGPDATVELRGGRPEHVETDLEVVPPRRTSRWMAPVLLVIFAAASLLGYALLQSRAPVDVARSFGTWTFAPSLGPTEETPVERDVKLPPIVAKIPESSAGIPAKQPAPAESAESTAAEPDATVPAPTPEPEAKAEPEAPQVAPVAKPAPDKAKPVQRAAAQRRPGAPRAAAIDPAREDEATRRLIERQVEGLKQRSAQDRDEPAGETYPPGYIEAEIR
jgi:hypothetical protein